MLYPAFALSRLRQLCLADGSEATNTDYHDMSPMKAGRAADSLRSFDDLLLNSDFCLANS